MPAFIASSCRDRTLEFTQVAERISRQLGTSTTGTSENGGTAAHQSQFAKRAAAIGLGIHNTSQKLQNLAQLAKRTSMFDDPAQEINALTVLIKQDIQDLNMGIAELQNLSALSKAANKQSTSHSHTVVDNLRSKLKDATKEFKDVLTLRTQNLKANEEHKKLFTATPVNGRLDGPGSSRGALHHVPMPSAKPAAPPLFGSTYKGNNTKSYNPAEQSSSSAEQQPLLAQRGAQLQMAAPQDTYLTDRAEALRNVESTIVELSTIFEQLAHMVQEQGEQATRIDQNVEEALANVDSAQTQLLRYMNSISSNRWLVMKIFAVLMVFLVIFVTFIA